MTADAQAAHHFGLVSDTDLTKLDSGVEVTCKVLDQLSEIDTAVGGEEKQYFGSVEADLNVDQFHFETALKNLFLTKIEGDLLFFAVFTHFFQIVLIGGANHLFKLTDDLTVGHVVVLTCDLAALGTSGCGNDDV